jgi:hypothetical protein
MQMLDGRPSGEGDGGGMGRSVRSSGPSASRSQAPPSYAGDPEPQSDAGGSESEIPF